MTNDIDTLVDLAEEYLILTTHDQDPSKNLPWAQLATELGEAIQDYKTNRDKRKQPLTGGKNTYEPDFKQEKKKKS